MAGEQGLGTNHQTSLRGRKISRWLRFGVPFRCPGTTPPWPRGANLPQIARSRLGQPAANYGEEAQREARPQGHGLRLSAACPSRNPPIAGLVQLCTGSLTTLTNAGICCLRRSLQQDELRIYVAGRKCIGITIHLITRLLVSLQIRATDNNKSQGREVGERWGWYVLFDYEAPAQSAAQARVCRRQPLPPEYLARV